MNNFSAVGRAAWPYVSSTLSTLLPLAVTYTIGPWVISRVISHTTSTITSSLSEENAKQIAKKASVFLEQFTREISDVGVRSFDRFNAGASWSLFKNYAPLGFAYVGVMVVVPLSLNYVYERLKHSIGKPKMAMKRRHYTLLTDLNPFSTPEEKAPEPIFNSTVSRRINEIVKTTANIKNNNGYFQNVLLWGPGGTGKTMISEMMAINSDMDYIMMSGAQLGQFIKRGEHVHELNRLFEKARKSIKPTLIFIDECEALCKNRGSGLSQEHIEILDTFLNLTGTPDKNIMLVMATNRVQDLDPAVLSRMDHKIFIGPPELEERTKIVGMYAKQFFENYPQDLEHFFNGEKAREIASKIEGFTGRAIFKLMNAIAAKKAMREDNCLTADMITETIDDFRKQEKELEKLFSENQYERNLVAAPPMPMFVNPQPLNQPVQKIEPARVSTSEPQKALSGRSDSIKKLLPRLKWLFPV